MTSDDKDMQHPHSPLHDHELEREEVHEVVVFLRKNGMSIAIALAIGVIAALGYIFYQHSLKQKQMYAAQALGNAQSIEALAAISKDFSGTPSAAVAQLEQAAAQFRAEEYEAALESYQNFMVRHPQHELTSATAVAIALCHEAQGDYELAAEQARAFLKKNPQHFMVPVATFCEARALTQTGKLDEARALYEEFIAAESDGIWTTQAETALLEVNRQIRAQAINQQ